MNPARYHRRHLLFALCIGAALGYGAHSGWQKWGDHRDLSAINTAPELALVATEAAALAVDIEQLRKDLSTRFIGDPRTLGEKLRDFVGENSIPQTIPLACKVVVDLAENSAALSDEELIELYRNQKDDDLLRVIAQVLSLRGDNQLLDDFVNKTAQLLAGDNPLAQRDALQTLAKTHYAGAANALLPALQISDTSVLLDALLALRATGNESHLEVLEPLLNHTDESVSWLAQDALKQLQNLSTKARTQVALADISNELPPQI